MLTLAFVVGEAPTAVEDRKVNEWLDESGQVIARAFSSSTNFHRIEWPGLGVFAFAAGSHEVQVWPDPNVLQETVLDAFYRMLQPVILQALGWQALHAGAAVGPTGVLAFCGKAGTGKSTLAFAMHQAGWQQFADDALVMRFDRDLVTAYSLPFTPGLRPASRAHFAHLCSPLASYGGLASSSLTAVFLLQQCVGLATPRVSLISRARAFSELLSHSHCFNAEDAIHTRKLVEDYLALAECVPVFTLEYRPDFRSLPQLTGAVMEAMTTINSRADGRRRRRSSIETIRQSY
jgi:hypothetical protein